MNRINVRFYDEVVKKLKLRTEAKKSGSIAQSIRELVDLGLKLEEATNQNPEGKNAANDLNFIVDIMKNNIRWTLESLLIVRTVIESLYENNTDESNLLLKKCKEQALGHVKKLFPEEGETVI